MFEVKPKENQINKKYFYLTTIPFLIAIIISLLLPFLKQHLPEKLPLFYSLPWGGGQLATHEQLFIIPSSIILITLINLLMSWNIKTGQNYFRTVLLISSAIFSLILLVTLIKIVYLYI